MDEETPQTLGEAIQECIENWCASNGGGMTLGFLAIVDRIDESGETVLTLSRAPQQPVHRSLGLAAYLQEWYRDDAQTQMLTAAGVFDRDEDDD